jgi:hypothetical protein
LLRWQKKQSCKPCKMQETTKVFEISSAEERKPLVPTAPAQIIRPQDVATVWPFAAPWLQIAIEANGEGYDLAELMASFQSGNRQLWSSVGDTYRGFLVTEVIQTHRGKEVHLILAGGYGLEQWFPELGVIELWARSLGANELKIWGRKGWERLLRKQGYFFETQVMRRRLDFGVN